MTDNKLVYGPPISEEPVPIGSLGPETETAAVEGRVFAVGHYELSTVEAWVVRFDLTDGTESIRVLKYVERDQADELVEQIQVGVHLRIYGTLCESRLEKETILKPISIRSAEFTERMDCAKEKRIELRVHTNMSPLDSSVSAADAVEKSCGHKRKGVSRIQGPD